MKILIFILLFISTASAQQTISDLTAKKFQVVSTSAGSKPCPLMSEVQRGAIGSPLNGQCIYNTTSSKLNIYNGTVWKAAGGGVDSWITATAYSIDDLVIESNKIYKCLIAHTSGTFATDLAASRWVEISAQVAVNLTGPITSVGAATAVASQTGTGSKFVMDTSPVLITPNIGIATGTSLALVGDISAYNYDRDNVLINGNLENALSSEWTCTVGACTRTTVSGDFSRDTAALKISLSAQAMNISQSVSTPLGSSTQYTIGASYKAPSAVTDFQICTLIAGSEKTCVPSANLIADGLFHTIEIPEVITAGSTVGIKFKTTAAYTQDIFIDNAYIKQGLGLAGIQLDNVYSFRSSTAGVVSLENRDFINGNASISATSVYTYAFVSGTFSAAPNCTCVTDRTAIGGNAICGIDSSSATQVVVETKIPGTGATVAGHQVICQKSGNDYLAASSSVYSQASANYSGRNDGVITIGATTTPPTKGTIVTDRIISSRDGNRLLAEYQYEVSVANSGGTGDLLFTLPQGLSFDSNIVMYTTDAIISATTSAKAAKSYIGMGSFGLSNGSGYHGVCELYAYDATRFRAWCVYENGDTGAGLANSTLFNVSIFAFKTGFNFKVDVPISGWTSASLITGSFNNYVSNIGLTSPHIYSAEISATGVVSSEKGNWLAGGPFTPTATNKFSLTINGGIFTQTPLCTFSMSDASSNYSTTTYDSGVTSTNILLAVRTFSAGSVSALPFKVLCFGE